MIDFSAAFMAAGSSRWESSGPGASIFVFCNGSTPSVRVVEERHAQGEQRIVTSRRTAKDSAPEFCETVSALLLAFHNLGLGRINEPELAGSSGGRSQNCHGPRRRWPEMF